MIAKFWDKMFDYVDSVRANDLDVNWTYSRCGSCKDAKEKCHVGCKKLNRHLNAIAKGECVRTAREIEDILQRTYDRSEAYRKRVKHAKPETEMQKAVCSISGIKVFYDKTDNTTYYELDGRHLDSEKEVFDHLKEIREDKMATQIYEERIEFINAVRTILASCASKLGNINVQEIVSERDTWLIETGVDGSDVVAIGAEGKSETISEEL